MMDNYPSPPRVLLLEVSRDLQPVKPSPSPSRLTVRLAPMAVLASIAILGLIGLRKDAAVIGPILTWGASIVQAGMGAMLIWMAARENTPARRLPKNIVWSTLFAACLVVPSISLWTYEVSEGVVPSGLLAARVGLVCGVGGTVVGGLIVLLFAWVFGHSLAVHPALTGALYGAGAGITVNAGWRLACPVSTPSHTLIAHGTAVIATTLLGSAAAHWASRRDSEVAAKSSE